MQTEALICAAQEQACRNNSVKYNIDKTIVWHAYGNCKPFN